MTLIDLKEKKMCLPQIRSETAREKKGTKEAYGESANAVVEVADLCSTRFNANKFVSVNSVTIYLIAQNV